MPFSYPSSVSASELLAFGTFPQCGVNSGKKKIAKKSSYRTSNRTSSQWQKRKENSNKNRNRDLFGSVYANSEVEDGEREGIDVDIDDTETGNLNENDGSSGKAMNMMDIVKHLVTVNPSLKKEFEDSICDKESLFCQQCEDDIQFCKENNLWNDIQCPLCQITEKNTTNSNSTTTTTSDGANTARQVGSSAVADFIMQFRQLPPRTLCIELHMWYKKQIHRGNNHLFPPCTPYMVYLHITKHDKRKEVVTALQVDRYHVYRTILDQTLFIFDPTSRVPIDVNHKNFKLILQVDQLCREIKR